MKSRFKMNLGDIVVTAGGYVQRVDEIELHNYRGNEDLFEVRVWSTGYKDLGYAPWSTWCYPSQILGYWLEDQREGTL
jgi:hypothetical protein